MPVPREQPLTRLPGERSGTSPGERANAAVRAIAHVFTRFEDVVYAGLGVLLGVSALVLLGHTAWTFAHAFTTGELPARIIELLDRILLILMVVEILYTVQVSLRQHTLEPEPFLIVGLIAAVRRVLVVTAEFPKLVQLGDGGFRNAMFELGLLTALIVALVVSVAILRRGAAPPDGGS